MANYNTLKAAIEAVIRTNGNEEITGAILQDSLIAMINALGLGYQYMGVATAATNPGTPDQKVFYIALAAGTYTNFGGATVRQGITILKWDTAWTANELFSFAGSYTFTGNINFANISISSFEEFYDELSETSLRNELDNLIPRVYSAHDRNIPIFDEYGNVIDGGKSIQDIFDEINKAAKPTGIYEKMVAGSSRGILSPSAIEELFLFQRTANGAGGTGAAVFQSIKGNSIVWNQLVQNGNFASGTTGWDITGTASVTDNELSVTIGSNGNCACVQAISCVAGHKYLVRFSARATASVNANLNDLEVRTESVALTTTRATFAYLVTPSTSGNKNFNLFTYNQTAAAGEKVYIKDVNVIDITLFTLSVTSVSDFTKFYNLPYYAPNPGAIKNNCATGMATDGLNQWDEIWEVGGIDSSGQNDGATNRFRSKNYIPIFPNTAYNFHYGSLTNANILYYFFYDASKVFISSGTCYQINTIITTPENAHYMRVRSGGNSPDSVYRYNICINISDPRNGQYEPHWSDTTALPITTATGKLNGEGESVVISPNGLAGVGSLYDEAIVEKGMWTKTAKRRMRVDMGTLNWSKEGDGVFMALIADDKSASKLFLCSKSYTIQDPGYYNTAYPDKSLWADQRSDNHAIYVKDTAYATAADLIAAMSDVILDYPLATERLYVLDTPVPVVARVDENGTQTILPQGVDESGVPMTAPFKASIQYPVKLGVAPIGQQSLVNLLERMKSAGKIASYTMFWDATTGVYDFTIS